MEVKSIIDREYCQELSETEKLKTIIKVYEEDCLYYADIMVILEGDSIKKGEVFYFDFFFAPCFLSSDTKIITDGSNLLHHGRRLSLQVYGPITDHCLILDLVKGYIGTMQQLVCALNYKIRVRKVRCSHCLSCKLFCFDYHTVCPDRVELFKSEGNLLVNREIGELTGILGADLKIEQVDKREKDIRVTYVITIHGVFRNNFQRNLDYKKMEQLPYDYPLCIQNSSISVCMNARQSVHYEIIWGQ